MGEQKVQSENSLSEATSIFLPDPNDIPRTIFCAVCLLAYATLVGLIAGHADFGFVVGLGAACGLGLHRVAVRRDWNLRSRIRRR